MTVLATILISVAAIFSVASLIAFLRLYAMYKEERLLHASYRSEVLSMTYHIDKLDAVAEDFRVIKTRQNMLTETYNDLIKDAVQEKNAADNERQNVLDSTHVFDCSVNIREGETVAKAKKRLASKLGYVLINEFPLFEDNTSVSIHVPAIINSDKLFNCDEEEAVCSENQKPEE